MVCMLSILQVMCCSDPCVSTIMYGGAASSCKAQLGVVMYMIAVDWVHENSYSLLNYTASKRPIRMSNLQRQCIKATRTRMGNLYGNQKTSLWVSICMFLKIHKLADAFSYVPMRSPHGCTFRQALVQQLLAHLAVANGSRSPCRPDPGPGIQT